MADGDKANTRLLNDTTNPDPENTVPETAVGKIVFMQNILRLNNLGLVKFIIGIRNRHILTYIYFPPR